MRVTLKDVAKEAGCSLAAVSTVLNGSKGNTQVSAELTEKVKACAMTLGYRPNHAAQALKGSGGVAVGLPIFAKEGQRAFRGFWTELMAGMEMAARRHQLSLMVIGEEESEAAPIGSRAIRYLHEGRINALVMPGFFEHALPVDLEHEQYPIVWLNKEQSHGHPAVGFNPEPGIVEAFKHLQKLGHKKIAWTEMPGLEERTIMAKAAAQMCGQELSVIRAEIDNSNSVQSRVHEACAAVGATLKQNIGFTAVVTATELHAMGAYYACMQAGLRIPEDISIVGFDDIRGDIMVPALTAISHHLPKIAERATEIALEISSADKPMSLYRNHHENISSSLVIRQSTAKVPEGQR